MELEEAQEFANQIVALISPFCDRITIAGSIRRKKPIVHDIDIVLIPRVLRWSRIIATLQKKMDAKVLKCREKVAQLTIDGINVDIYATNPKQWDALLWIRTGSAEHNITLSMRARKLGMKLTHSGLSKDGKIIASTEKGIFEALGMEYVSPEER